MQLYSGGMLLSARENRRECAFWPHSVRKTAGLPVVGHQVSTSQIHMAFRRKESISSETEGAKITGWQQPGEEVNALYLTITVSTVSSQGSRRLSKECACTTAAFNSTTFSRPQSWICAVVEFCKRLFVFGSYALESTFFHSKVFFVSLGKISPITFL